MKVEVVVMQNKEKEKTKEEPKQKQGLATDKDSGLQNLAKKIENQLSKQDQDPLDQLHEMVGDQPKPAQAAQAAPVEAAPAIQDVPAPEQVVKRIEVSAATE